MLRVALIEDDHRYRATLEELFARAEGFVLAGSFGSPAAALADVERHVASAGGPPWDIALTDIEMPGMNGIELTRRLKSVAPDLKVVVLTVFEQPGTILDAICAGADGYLLKRARARELLDGVRAVSDGGAPLTPQIARSVLELMRSLGASETSGTDPAPSRLSLTEREQQVLRALVEGLSYKQAADVLGIGLGTVRTHIAGVYRKLQVHSVAEAVARAIRERIV